MSQGVLKEYGEVLLTSGAWGTMAVEYDATYEIKGRKYPFYIKDFTPFQVTRLDLDDYVGAAANSRMRSGSTWWSRASASIRSISTGGRSGS